MPISDPQFAVAVLNSLSASGVTFVVLHSEHWIGTSELSSDVDIAVDSPVAHVIARASNRLAEQDIAVALIWFYDLGGGASVFFSNRDGTAGAQIDMLHDLNGRGRYGIRSGRLITASSRGLRYRVPNELDGLLYSLVKSSLKGKRGSTNAFSEELMNRYEAIIDSRISELFASSMGRVVRALTRGKPRPYALRPARWVNSIARLATRIKRPIGLWVEIVGFEAEEAASRVSKDISGWLARVDYAERPRGLRVFGWWLARVAPIRWRPGVFISWSIRTSFRPTADLILYATNEPLGKDIVRAMAARATS